MSKGYVAYPKFPFLESKVYFATAARMTILSAHGFVSNHGSTIGNIYSTLELAAALLETYYCPSVL